MAVLNGVYKRTPQARNAVIQRAEELKTGRIDVETRYNAGLVKVKSSV